MDGPFNLNPPRWGRQHSMASAVASARRILALQNAENAAYVTCGAFVEHRAESRDPFAAEMLEAIKTNGSRLRLYVAEGEFHRLATTVKTTVFRLESQEHQGYLDFDLVAGKGGFDAHALILHIKPEAQGSFYNFKSFIEKISATLFGLKTHRVFLLYGRAVKNQYPCRQAADWRGVLAKNGRHTKLIRLYQRAGFVLEPKTNTVFLFSAQTWRERESLLSSHPKELAEFRALKSFERKTVTRKHKGNL